MSREYTKVLLFQGVGSRFRGLESRIDNAHCETVMCTALSHAQGRLGWAQVLIIEDAFEIIDGPVNALIQQLRDEQGTNVPVIVTMPSVREMMRVPKLKDLGANRVLGFDRIHETAADVAPMVLAALESLRSA